MSYLEVALANETHPTVSAERASIEEVAIHLERQQRIEERAERLLEERGDRVDGVAPWGSPEHVVALE